MRLSAPQPDGVTLREHLKRAVQAGAPDPLFAEAHRPLPRAGAALWDVYRAIRSAGPVRHSEIRAWEEINRWRLSPWEVETLLCVDRAARDVDDAQRHKEVKR